MSTTSIQFNAETDQLVVSNDLWVVVGRSQKDEVEILEPTLKKSQSIKINQKISSIDLTDDHRMLVVGLDGQDVLVYQHDGN